MTTVNLLLLDPADLVAKLRQAALDLRSVHRPDDMYEDTCQTCGAFDGRNPGGEASCTAIEVAADLEKICRELEKEAGDG
jgi:hypothetical protein